MIYQMFLYFFTTIAMSILYFLPGFLIASFFKKFDNIEKIAISFLFSTILFFVIGGLFYFFGIQWSWLLLVPYLSTIVTLLIVRKKFGLERVDIDKEIKLLLILFFIILLYKVILQIFIKYYPMGSDYIKHYKTSLFFLGEPLEQSVLYSRNPGFYMLIGFFLAIFGKEFWVAQIASTLVNTVFIFPTYCLAKRLFNKRIAILSILFLQITPFIEISLYIFAKMLVAYFSILFLYLFLTKKDSNYLLGIIAGVAYLVHPSSLIFISAAIFPLVLQIFRKKEKIDSLRFIRIVAFFLITVSPWIIINYLTSSDYRNWAYFTLPFATSPENHENLSPKQLLVDFVNTPITYLIKVRAINSISAITPAILIIKIISQFMPITVQTHEITNFADVPWAYHYYHSLPGNLTLLLYVFAVIGAIRLWKENRTLFYFITLPIIYFSLYFGWVILAVVRSGLPTIIPVLVMVGFWKISKKKNSDRWIKLVFIFGIIEAIIFSIFFSWHIQLTEQIAIERGNLQLYENLLSAYKLFRNL